MRSTSSTFGLLFGKHLPRAFGSWLIAARPGPRARPDVQALQLFILYGVQLAIFPFAAMSEFLLYVVHDTINKRGRPLQFAQELMLVMLKRIDDAGDPKKLGPRLLVGGSCVCNKLQLEDRTTLGHNGVAPDRSWDTGPSYVATGS